MENNFFFKFNKNYKLLVFISLGFIGIIYLFFNYRWHKVNKINAGF